jgi:hypothetical protein
MVKKPLKGFVMATATYVPITVDDLLQKEEIIFSAQTPILVQKGEDFSFVMNASRIKIDNHESDERPYQLIIYSYGLVVCSVFFDDVSDFGLFFRKE